MSAPSGRARRPEGDGPSLPEKFTLIHKELKTAGVPHAFGGDLALAYYLDPSVTMYIDLNVFVSPERWQEVIDALAPLGIKVDGLDAKALERDGQCRLWWGDNPIDLFFAYDPIHTEMKKEVRRVPFADTTIPILSPEHLAVCKAMFDRPKDWIDIEQMLVAADDLDVDEIESWLERMVGVSDHRLRQFAELKEKVF